MVMHSAILLASENRELRVFTQRQKRKRETPRSYIGNGGVLSVQEGLDRA